MNKSKSGKGITLVALIITIIVLLILAVVAISAVNNTGIIQYAQNASQEYTDERDEENTMVGNYSEIVNHYKPKKDTTITLLLKDLYWYEENEDNGITILGPKKVWSFNQEKAKATVSGIIDAEYGTGMFDGVINGTVEIEDEELLMQIVCKIELEADNLVHDFSNNEYWVEREIKKEEIGDVFTNSEERTTLRIYSTEKLPNTINGKSVTKIADSAFEDIWVINSEFIPNTVEVIGESAFYNSYFKSQLIIPDSVKEIKKYAFYDLGEKIIKIEDGELIFESITLIMNDAENKLERIEHCAFCQNGMDSTLVGNLNLRSEININSSAFSETKVIVNRIEKNN